MAGHDTWRVGFDGAWYWADRSQAACTTLGETGPTTSAAPRVERQTKRNAGPIRRRDGISRRYRTIAGDRIFLQSGSILAASSIENTTPEQKSFRPREQFRFVACKFVDELRESAAQGGP
jgi:hypothetical protein